MPTRNSRTILLSCWILVACLCQTCARPADESLQLEMKANIGKIAYNATNGKEIGTIVGVTAAVLDYAEKPDKPSLVYQIRRGDQVLKFPPANVTIK